MPMTSPTEGSNPSPDGSPRAASGAAALHYAVGGIAVVLALMVVYAFFFEDEAPPFLFGRELSEPQKIEVAGERPVIVIEDVDFGKRDGHGQEEDLASGSVLEPAEAKATDLTEEEPTLQGAGKTEDAEPAADDPGLAVRQTDQAAGPEAADESEQGDPEPEPAPQREQAAAAQPVGDFVVQIIATRLDDTAERLSAEVRNAGMPSYVERIDYEGQELHRVRVGPFASRGEAEIAKRDLQGLGHGDAVVIDLR